MVDRQELDRRGLLHLLVVYIVWGSTYLAIRVGVQGEDGFPPFTMAALRVFAGSAILLLWARSRGERVRLSREEAILLGGSGLLLWIGGNGLVSWAEKNVSSGLAALLVAVMPIWGELISSIVDRRLPSLRMSLSILLGFAGVTVLLWPILQQGTSADIQGVVALIMAPFFWALGSIWFQRNKPDLTDRSISGWQQLLGGVGLLIVALGRREGIAHPSLDAWLAWGYLVAFGSVLAFTSYMATLRLLPYSVVLTYAYANPAIAVLLGHAILGGEITR